MCALCVPTFRLFIILDMLFVPTKGLHDLTAASEEEVRKNKPSMKSKEAV